jgi:lipopolysaccharide/colanic/teichoic acid biosynthesis glycosyltransferase
VTKRLFDLFASAVGMLILAPIVVVIAIQVRLKLGIPVIFLQSRPGLNGQPFKMLKFRTMRNIYDVDGKLLPDPERLNNFGLWLRSTSLDELPELWNVLKGDMSLVGPRPLLEEYLPLYSTEQARRHEVKPGITGWAQINGRNAISWDEKFKLDCWYVDNRSFWLDIKILWLTLLKVLARENISTFGDETAPKFTGNTKNDN